MTRSHLHDDVIFFDRRPGKYRPRKGLLTTPRRIPPIPRIAARRCFPDRTTTARCARRIPSHARGISATRPDAMRRYLPGSSDSARPTSLPLQSAAPSCGHCVRKCEILALDVEDADLAALHVHKLAGAGSDLSRPWRRRDGSLKLLQPVQRLGVVAENHAAMLFVDLAFEHIAGIVEVPMRIVGREHDAVEADPAHDVVEIVRGCPALRSAAS